MLLAILIAGLLVAVTVTVHAAGFGLLLKSLMNSPAGLPTEPWPVARLLIRVTWWLILIHLVEITVWACFYLWGGCLPDAEAAFYFSGVTYTTIGYGDLVLAKPWRILGPIEGLTGILMCGLSAGLFFALVTRIFVPRFEAKRK
ncbi:MAG: two pore domain potassium channel family protein [Verrucomicrobia bacterium]|nr:two pore domain potassium channel family protein [Verrucomicrobiota bacterium]